MMESIEEFKKFLETCRVFGVTKVFFKGVQVEFGPQAVKDEPSTDVDDIISEKISDEQMLFYSAQPGVDVDEDK